MATPKVFVHGKNVTLKVFKGGSYVQVACLIDVLLWMKEEYFDTSTPDSGRYITRAPMNIGDWGIKIESVTVLTDPDETLYFTWEFFLELARSNGVNIELVITDRLGGTKVYRGLCFLPYSEIAGRVGEVSRSNIELIAGGPIQFDGSVTPQNFDTMRIEWFATADQTEFQDNNLIGRSIADILYVNNEAEDKYKVVSGTPTTNREVKLDSAAGKLVFLQGAENGAYIYTIIRTS